MPTGLSKFKQQTMKYLKNLILIILLGAALTQCKSKETSTTSTNNTAAATELPQEDVATITKNEIATWEFAKTKQLDKMDQMLADDYQAFFGKVLMSKAEVLLSFKNSDIDAYRLSNIRVKKISDDVAIIYYDALQDAIDPDGDRWVPKISASNTYVKRGNTWYAVFYQEIPTME